MVEEAWVELVSSRIKDEIYCENYFLREKGIETKIEEEWIEIPGRIPFIVINYKILIKPEDKERAKKLIEEIEILRKFNKVEFWKRCEELKKVI